MSYIKKLAVGLIHEEDGPTTVEYAVMIAVILVGCISAVLSTGDVQQGMFQETGDAMNQAMFDN